MTEVHGCAVSVSCVNGPVASELVFSCRPPAGATDHVSQAEAIYRAALAVLGDRGAGYDAVVSETVFLADLQAQLALYRDARHRVLAGNGADAHRPACLEVEQPPSFDAGHIQVMFQAVLCANSPGMVEIHHASTTCACNQCASMQGLRVSLGQERRLHAGSLFGGEGDAYEQTLAMFREAEQLLERAGMAFTDVMRTWIYFREMQRDYPNFNRARRDFFASRGIDPVPASTGIGATDFAAPHDLCLGLYAVQGVESPLRTVMSSATLNEAPAYGSDFSRGMRVEECNRVALYVSGTASLDETGATVHEGDLEAQADRMLLNVAALLERQGAGFGDIVSAITYVKRPEDASALERRLANAGYHGFPHVLVQAEVCRPELLCETELVASLPRSTD